MIQNEATFIPRSPSFGKIKNILPEIGEKIALEIYQRADYSRQFEYEIIRCRKEKIINQPVYLSIGEEYIPSALSLAIKDPHVFLQHRLAATYLSFGGSAEKFRDEILGLETGCCQGRGGFMTMQDKEKNIYGGTGLIGENYPICVGATFASKETSIVLTGDAGIEEDYVYPALGMAQLHKLPILFICVDNDFSILTRTKERRNWNAVDVCKSLGIESYDLADDPWSIYELTRKWQPQKGPIFLNIRTVRIHWHEGIGTDGPPEWDRHQIVFKELSNLGLEKKLVEITKLNKERVKKIWGKIVPRS